MVLRRVELAKNVGAGIDAILDDAVAGYDEYLAPVVLAEELCQSPERAPFDPLSFVSVPIESRFNR